MSPDHEHPSDDVKEALEQADLDALRAELQRRLAALSQPSNNEDDVQKSVARLVLALVEFLRQVMERQAVRRMEQGTLSAAEIEKLGVGLMQLEDTVREIAARFGLSPADLNLDLGPLGRLR